MPQQILVPYPFEAALSGIRVLPAHGYMWYRRQLNIPASVTASVAAGTGRVLLKFEAVDWQAHVYLGGCYIGNHSGGYTGFQFDITSGLGTGGSVELVVGVYDPTENGLQPHGKQLAAAFAATRASSKYTSTSGIWATVWLEFVPTSYISELEVVTTAADVAATEAKVEVTASVAGTSSGCNVAVVLLDGDTVAANSSATAGLSVTVTMSKPKLWSPGSPFLYNATVELYCGAGAAVDSVHSYVGVRTVRLSPRRSTASAGCTYSTDSVLPGYPKPAASAADCESTCIAPACAAWSFAPPGPAPPTPAPPGAPRVGFDYHGNDLPNMPIPLGIPFSPNGSAAKCEELCDQESQCEAWSIDVPGCKYPGHATFNASLCWLKATAGRLIEQRCRICGIRKQQRRDIADPAVCTLHSMVPAVTNVSAASAAGSSCGHWSTKIMLNGQVAPFLAGILSQGFWPDGEYAAPDDRADVYELESHRAMGFNYIRKHIKVGPHRWYYHTDRLGIMVSQDMPETIHATGTAPTFMKELGEMVIGRRNHPSIFLWDLFNEARPSPEVVAASTALVRSLDRTRPINAISGATAEQQPLVQAESDVQDLHTDQAPTFQGPVNASLVVFNSEAHRCGCLPPTQHMWFHALPIKAACYSVTQGVDCAAASATYLPWAVDHATAIRYTGLSGTGYVQNRDMEGECNGLMTYDGAPKLDPAPIRQGNALLMAEHEAIWSDQKDY